MIPVHAFIEDPRRARRVVVQLRAELSFGSVVWTSATFDVGPGGCGLDGDRHLAQRDDLFVVLEDEVSTAKLQARALVAWTGGGRSGLRFVSAGRGPTPRAWFGELLAGRPSLVATEPKLERIAMTSMLSRRRRAGILPPLSPQEGLLFRLVTGPTPLRALAFHSGLPPPEFARALFGLLEKGMLLFEPAPDIAPAFQG